MKDVFIRGRQHEPAWSFIVEHLSVQLVYPRAGMDEDEFEMIVVVQFEGPFRGEEMPDKKNVMLDHSLHCSYKL